MTKPKKLAILSDLHLDVNHLDAAYESKLIQTLQDLGITDLHLAGDLSNDLDGLSKPFVSRLSNYFITSYNLGNHDMLGLTESDIQSHDFKLRRIGRKQLLSFAGWYDYSFCPEIPFEQNVRTKNTFWFDRKLKRAADDVTTTQNTLRQLEDLLSKLSTIEKANLIIAMHFVPEKRFVMTHPKFVKLNAFLGAQGFHDLFVKHGIQDVVFGHNHRSYDVVIQGVHYQSRPLGYRREWAVITDFLKAYPNPEAQSTYNLHRRYRLVSQDVHFESYLLTHFPEEIKKSLVIFDL